MRANVKYFDSKFVKKFSGPKFDGSARVRCARDERPRPNVDPELALSEAFGSRGSENGSTEVEKRRGRCEHQRTRSPPVMPPVRAVCDIYRDRPGIGPKS